MLELRWLGASLAIALVSGCGGETAGTAILGGGSGSTEGSQFSGANGGGAPGDSADGGFGGAATGSGDGASGADSSGTAGTAGTAGTTGTAGGAASGGTSGDQGGVSGGASGGASGGGSGDLTDGGVLLPDGGIAPAVPPVRVGDCTGPQSRDCYPFAPDTYGVGECSGGSQSCEGGEFAFWSECTAAAGPGVETCNGKDDDCDGAVDEFGSESCGLGVCRTSVELCQGGVAQTCKPLDVATTEVCNGLDDDCDGAIDDGVGTGVTVRCGLGSCDHTVEACTQGEPPACDPFEGAIVEVCNGFDDDCDGQTDEDLLNACGTCGPAPVETCNGLDDDCDGATDEGLLNACGQCGATPTEVCNGIDDDCDGSMDEGLLNACGECGSTPAEVCNGTDDDCDGMVDEGLLNACGECGSTPAEACGNGVDDDCDGLTDEDCTCEAAIAVDSAEIRNQPVDLLMMVDNSCSMNAETAWVQQQLQDFADDLATRGLDLRVILLTAQGTDTRDICIAPPLGGPSCGDNPAQNFYHVDENISSTLGWHDLEDEVARWRPLLRANAALHIAMISDDDERWDTTEFWERWNGLSGVPETFTYHAVVCESDCEHAASIGVNHLDLVAQTGGVKQDLCDQDFGLAFAAIADGIDVASIACEWTLPDAPPGGVLDTGDINVSISSSGSGTSTLSKKSSLGACGTGTGYVLEGDVVRLCDASCAGLQGDENASVEVSVGCTLTGN